jgi:hypothetical protein
VQCRSHVYKYARNVCIRQHGPTTGTLRLGRARRA